MNLDTLLAETMQRIDRSGFSIAEICREARMDPSLISRWKAGAVEPRISSLIRVNEAIDALLDAHQARMRRARR